MRNRKPKQLKSAARLLGGAAAGPLFVATFSAIGGRRSGYSWQRHTVSTLAADDGGWQQRANFILVGSLYTLAASALLRRPRGSEPRAVPVLLAGAGIGLIGSGIFVTDPIAGYPPTTDPDGERDVIVTDVAAHTREGTLHNLCAIPVFFGMPLAGIASAIAAARKRNIRWASYSVGSSVAMVASFALMGVAFGGDPRFAGKGGLFQRVAIAAGFGWASAFSLRALASLLDS